MRTVRFKEVLWSVARKAGYSPESGNFITNQAIPIGEYISDYVDRLYTQEDWPEWTKITQVAPFNHIVPYEFTVGRPADPLAPAPADASFKMGRILTVYLVDPKTTTAPISTPFRLREDGVHCGYEHGTNVWIKYLEPAPTFTAVPWRADVRYGKGNAVYSPTSGECYKSLINNNLNHDPVSNFSPNPDLTIEETQALELPEPGIPPQPQIIDYYVADLSGDTTIADPIPNGASFTLGLNDTTGVSLAAHSQIQGGTTSTTALLAALKVMFDADGLAGFSFTNIPPNIFRVSSSVTEFVTDVWRYFPPATSPWTEMRFIQVQPFSAGVAGSDGVNQVLKLTIGDNAFIPGGTYSLTATDLDGTEHVVEYQSSMFDNRNQILNGLLMALGSSTDEVLSSIGTSTNTVEESAFLSLNRQLGISAEVSPPGSQYWKFVPFPAALFNPIVRGASAALMAEWGQTATATAEEGKVSGETDNVRGDFDTTPNPPLTTQQRSLSRYRL